MTDTASSSRPRRRVIVCAGDPSGDQHAARVVAALRRRRPDLAFEAFGGPALEAAGCELREDLTPLATMVVGFLSQLGRYAGVLRRFDRTLVRERPVAVILVDSPGLNFLFARLARWRGVPVVDYICPQIWAWGPWRRAKVLAWCDLLLPILPFEQNLYENGGVPVHWVGHPLPDELAGWTPEVGTRWRERASIGSGEHLLGLFPGSRRQEIDALGEVLLAIAGELGRGRPGLRVAISVCREEFRAPLEGAARRLGLEVELFGGDAHELMVACDTALVASGTASLELAWFEKPMVVLYRTSRLGRRLFRAFSVTPWISLPNILGEAGSSGSEARPPTVPEILFVGDPTERVLPLLAPLVDGGPEREAAIERLHALRRHALGPGGVERAAEAIARFLSAPGTPGAPGIAPTGETGGVGAE